MICNPERRNCRSIRLRGYDYTQPGAYFVTVCTRERECSLGRIENRRVILTEYGRLAERCWHDLPRHFPQVELDAFVVMPNHVHGIIVIADTGIPVMVGATHASPLRDGPSSQPAGPRRGSLGAIIGAFKSAATRRINDLRTTPGLPVWQRNYYERIIRNEDELRRIRQYIQENPARWETDENHPDNIKSIGQIRRGLSRIASTERAKMWR